MSLFSYHSKQTLCCVQKSGRPLIYWFVFSIVVCLLAISQNHYEKISGRKTPTHSHHRDEGSEEMGDKVTLYLLAHRFLSRNGQGVEEGAREL